MSTQPPINEDVAEYVNILRNRISELEQQLATARVMWRQTQKEFDAFRHSIKRQLPNNVNHLSLVKETTQPEPPKKA